MSKDKQKSYEFFKNDLIDKEKKDSFDPFVNDASDKYKDFSTNITKLISEQGKEKPIIISLEATYGMGKTTLIDMWGTDLIANKKSIAIKYNAWEEDHSHEPFYSFVSSLIYQLSFFYVGNKEKNETLKIFTVEAQNLWTTISGSAASLGKIASNIWPHLKAVSSAVEVVKKIFSALADMNKKNNEPSQAFKSLVKKEGDMREAVKSFKLNLEKLAEDKSIFIFIDEIDRCKPTFAIELLERIKHLFNVPNVFFIVATTAHALQQNVRKFYGYESELAKEYLERFFDFQFKIPTIEFTDYMKHLVETKGDDILTMEAWDLRSLSNYGAIQNYIDRNEITFTMPKDFLMKMVRNCEDVINKPKHPDVEKIFQTLSFRILNKALNDILIFNQFYIGKMPEVLDKVPPEMYGFVLALILSHRLSVDKKEYVKNYSDLLNGVKNINTTNSSTSTSENEKKLNTYLKNIFENTEDTKKEITLTLSQSQYINNNVFNGQNSRYLLEGKEKLVLTSINARLADTTTCIIYRFLKERILDQIEQVASIQSDDA